MTQCSVSFEGFRAHNETWDHVWEVDGKGDEVYVHYSVAVIDNKGQVVLSQADRTPTFGDRNGFPNRVQAGTRSNKGGIKTGDEFFDHSLTLYQGPIPSGGGIAIIPTIWEWDGGTDLFNTWGQSLVDHGPAIAKAVIDIVKATQGVPSQTPTAADFILDAAKTGLPELFAFVRDIVGQAKDRPIGMSGNAFSGKTLVLNEAAVAAAVKASFSDRGNGVLPFNYVDTENNYAGNYTIYLKVSTADYVDGTMVKDGGADPVYVMYGGAKLWLPGPEWVERYGGWGNVKVVPEGSLTGVPAIPQDGTVVREWSSAPIYLIKGRQRSWISSPARLEELGILWSDVRVVPDGALANIPLGSEA